MNPKNVKVGNTYWHMLDGSGWRWKVRIINVEREKDDLRRYVWDGDYWENGEWHSPCWGYVSDLKSITQENL